jgi:hypothetical protein
VDRGRDRFGPARARRRLPGLDWSKPIGDWPKGDVVGLLEEAFRLIVRAIVARDAEEERLTGKGGASDAASRLIAELDRIPPFLEQPRQ